MATLFFIWLGSGRSRKRPIGPEGCLLDQAAHAGLPVPSGAILLDEFFWVCLEKGLAVWASDQIIIPDIELFHNTLFYSAHLPKFEHPISVSPITSFNEEPILPAAGNPAPVHFDASQPEALAKALSAAWSSPTIRHKTDRRDVLLVEQVGATHRGFAYTLDGELVDRVVIHAGEQAPASESLPVLRGWQATDPSMLPYARRLQLLLRGVRHTFGSGDWVIEWADDDRICRLVRAMPIPAAFKGQAVIP